MPLIVLVVSTLVLQGADSKQDRLQAQITSVITLFSVMDKDNSGQRLFLSNCLTYLAQVISPSMKCSMQ